jgi:hypothetical protein
MGTLRFGQFLFLRYFNTYHSRENKIKQITPDLVPRNFLKVSKLIRSTGYLMSFYTLFIYLFCLFNAVSSEGMRRNNISVVTKEKYSPLRLISEYPLRSVKNDKQQVPNNVRPIRSDGNNYIHRACSSNVVRSLYVLRYFNRTVDKAFSISFKYTQSEKEKRRRHENNYPAVQRQKNIALSSSPLNRIPLPSSPLFSLSSLSVPLHSLSCSLHRRSARRWRTSPNSFSIISAPATQVLSLAHNSDLLYVWNFENC